jgi:hypothetical protein
MIADRYSHHTHVAFADESSHNIGRYRSLALVTCARGDVDALVAEAAALLASSNVHELKWSSLNSARDRHAAEKIATWAVDRAAERRLAIDALVWDTHDARHAVMRRDDAANLHRMYYWLLSTTLRRPGLAGAIWVLRPDENGLMRWASVHDVLDNAGRRPDSTSSLLLWRRARRQYAIEQIVPTVSATAPLIQVADLIAGLSAYSHESFGVYEDWCRCETDKTQTSLAFPDEDVSALSFSRTDRERCHVLQHLNQRCKLRRMGVSLATNRGLTTFPPGYGLRFWLYRPQSDADRAPLRGERAGAVRQLLTATEVVDPAG